MAGQRTTDARSRVWPSFVVLAVAVVVAFVCGAGVSLVFMARRMPRDGHFDLAAQPMAFALVIAATQAGLFLAVRYVPRWLDDEGPEGWHARVAWRTRRVDLGTVLLLGIGTHSLGWLCQWVVTAVGVPGSANARLAQVVRDASPLGTVLMLLAVGLAPGVVEEVLFRGYLQTRVVARWGPRVGIGLTALLFGAFHMDWRQGATAVVLGVWLGLCAHRERHIVHVMGAHAISNSLTLLLSRFAPQLAEPWPFAVLCSFELAACSVLFMHRTRFSKSAREPPGP